MPRSAAQCDFDVTSPPDDAPAIEGPIAPGTEVVELPRAAVRTTQASARATRIVMGFTWFVLAVLALLTLIGPHVPSGE